MFILDLKKQTPKSSKLKKVDMGPLDDDDDISSVFLQSVSAGNAKSSKLKKPGIGPLDDDDDISSVFLQSASAGNVLLDRVLLMIL